MYIVRLMNSFVLPPRAMNVSDAAVKKRFASCGLMMWRRGAAMIVSCPVQRASQKRYVGKLICFVR